jgi:Mpv17 / PMP22 family
LLTGKHASHVGSKAEGIVRERLWPTMLMNWTMWPFAGLINFKFIAPDYRVAFMSSVALIWNTYLSVVGNRKPEELVEEIEDDVDE